MKKFILTAYTTGGEIEISKGQWVYFDYDETIFNTVEAKTKTEAIKQGKQYLIEHGYDEDSEEYFPYINAIEIAEKNIKLSTHSMKQIFIKVKIHEFFLVIFQVKKKQHQNLIKMISFQMKQ